MVQFFQGLEDPRLASAGVAGEKLGQSLSDVLQQHYVNKTIDKLISDPANKDLSTSERLQKMLGQLSRHGPKGMEEFGRRFQLEQIASQEKEQAKAEQTQGILAKAIRGEALTKQEESKLPADAQLKLVKQKKNLDVSQKLASNLTKRGLDPEIAQNMAELYSTASEGGKTAILNNIFELENRGLLKSQGSDFVETSELEEGFSFPPIAKEKGMKPAEIVRLQKEREKTNIPFYNENNRLLTGLRNEALEISRLNQLNKSEKLPSGVQRLNVNFKTGELIVPALASPEAQLFAKTINDFTRRAKDSYGARVTNFDLDQFMKRLPTLANTTEGRDLILSQMKILNELDSLEHESLKAAYDHYGVANINAQQAQKAADLYKKDREKDLIQNFKTLEGRLDSLEKTIPSPTPQSGIIQMTTPDGRTIYVPEKDVDEATKLGAKRK